MYSAPVLYLDFDGVLHPDEVYRYVKAPHIRLNAPGHQLFEHAPLLEHLIEPYPALRIVLSTSWVRAFDFHRARKRLPAALKGRVVGATYHTRSELAYDFQHMNRYQQIAQDVLRRSPAQWIALDNDAKGWPEHARGRLVKTPDFEGLGCPMAQTLFIERLRAMFS